MANQIGMKRLAGIALSLGMLGSLVFSAAPAAACSGPSGGPIGGGRPEAKQILKDSFTAEGQSRGSETTSLRTLHIEAEVLQDHYAIGDVAKFPVHVTRPAKEDPARLGLPWERPYVEDAAGVNVGVGLLIGDVFLPGFAITDDEGKATIKIKIKQYAQPAAVDAAFYSWNVVADTPCLRVEENGFVAFSEMFHVHR